jgi:hypothetical protein
MTAGFLYKSSSEYLSLGILYTVSMIIKGNLIARLHVMFVNNLISRLHS